MDNYKALVGERILGISVGLNEEQIRKFVKWQQTREQRD
jgi:hypothetical protein